MAERKKREVPEKPQTEETLPVENNQSQAGENGQTQADTTATVETPLEVDTISVPTDEYEALQQELDNTRNKANEYFDGWQRERADFSNYRKRIERDQALVYQNAVGTIVKRYLPVLDDLERALKSRPGNSEGADWAAGIELIYRKLQSILESEGITRMPAESEAFDPNRHEAISHEDSPDHETGQIIEVVRQGYLQGERVLRPALVRVAR
jgi:molecular chaperone GrpE